MLIQNLVDIDYDPNDMTMGGTTILLCVRVWLSLSCPCIFLLKKSRGNGLVHFETGLNITVMLTCALLSILILCHFSLQQPYSSPHEVVS